MSDETLSALSCVPLNRDHSQYEYSEGLHVSCDTRSPAEDIPIPEHLITYLAEVKRRTGSYAWRFRVQKGLRFFINLAGVLGAIAAAVSVQLPDQDWITVAGVVFVVLDQASNRILTAEKVGREYEMHAENLRRLVARCAALAGNIPYETPPMLQGPAYADLVRDTIERYENEVADQKRSQSRLREELSATGATKDQAKLPATNQASLPGPQS